MVCVRRLPLFALGAGQMPPRLSETGPEEIRQLSRGFNQLATNLKALEADRRLMLVGISHDLATPLTRLRLGLELLELKGDLTQVTGMVHDLDDMNAILAQFKDYARSGKEEQLAGLHEVEVSPSLKSGKLVLAVLDRGPGVVSMDPSQLVRPFVREGASRSTPIRAGLGLSIVDRIAKSHGGDLRLQNRDGGVLAATVTLPM